MYTTHHIGTVTRSHGYCIAPVAQDKDRGRAPPVLCSPPKQEE